MVVPLLCWLVPMVGDIWPKLDESWDWEFEVAGTYDVPRDGALQPWFLLGYDYFNESVADWAKERGRPGGSTGGWTSA